MADSTFACPKCGDDTTVATLVGATRMIRYDSTGEELTSEVDYDHMTDEKCVACNEPFDEKKWKGPAKLDGGSMPKALEEFLTKHDGLSMDVKEDRMALANALNKAFFEKN